MTANLDDRLVTTHTYGRTTRHFVRPRSYRCAELAAALADALVDVASEIQNSLGVTATAVRSFCAHLDQNNSHATDLTIETVTRAEFDSWELTERFRQTATGTSTSYSYVVQLLALLRRIEDDRPGTLRPNLPSEPASRPDSRTFARSAHPDTPAVSVDS